MTKIPRKYWLLGAAAYVGYRFYTLQADAADGTASMVDDIMSTLQTAGNIMTTSSAGVNQYFDCVDPNTGINWTDTIVSSARMSGVPPLLLASQLWQESRFRANAYNNRSGCAGIAQFKADTAADYGLSASDRYLPEKAIPAQAKYMSYLHRQFGTWPLALAAYNWGMGNLKRKGMANAPKETRDYIAIIYTPYAAQIGL